MMETANFFTKFDAAGSFITVLKIEAETRCCHVALNTFARAGTTFCLGGLNIGVNINSG